MAKILGVKMEEETHQPNELNSQMRVMKRYLKARYRLSDLLRAQRNDRMSSNLKMWIEKGAPDKGDLEEDSYRILRQYFMQKEGRLYLKRDRIVACKRRELLLALLDIHQSKPMRVNMKEPVELEPMKKIDEIRS